jgi:hypothetical protein
LLARFIFSLLENPLIVVSSTLNRSRLAFM